MRLNVRKCLAISAIFVVIWLIVSYSSMIDVPRSITGGNTAKVMEEKLDKLQKIMDTELEESSKLLEKVKLQLYKSEEKIEDEAEKQADYGQKPGPILPILVIACDRVTVKRCLDNLVKFRPDKETFPIIVSQDCGHLPTYQVIKSFADADPTITVVKQPDLSPIYVDRTKVKFKGYYKIARHFKFALNYVLATLKHEAVIIVEDDLDISPDFFEYFLGTYPLLHSDPSLWCISAWNDNGKKEVIDLTRPELLHRTDFFPGLGWLLRQETWLQLEPHWPAAFFDDWLRNPENTQGRACIRPEISRTYSFGKIGVSKGLFFDMHLRHMQLNMDYVEFTKLNLTYLLKKNYDPVFEHAVYSAPVMTADEVISLPPTSGDVRVTYSNAKTYQKAAKKLGLMDDFRMLVKKDRPIISARDITSQASSSGDVRVTYSDAKSFQKAAKKLGLMDDFRSGIPRAAYLGVVTCYVRGRRVYLAPDFTWHKYDPSWG